MSQGEDSSAQGAQEDACHDGRDSPDGVRQKREGDRQRKGDQQTQPQSDPSQQQHTYRELADAALDQEGRPEDQPRGGQKAQRGARQREGQGVAEGRVRTRNFDQVVAQKPADRREDDHPDNPDGKL